MEREIIEQEIELRTESIIPFPKDDYYTKYEVDDLLDDKADENVVNEILLDISSIEDEQILQNNSITNLGNDITSINGDIQEIESDMNNLSLITETGSQIALNTSTSDYKMTAILKDKNGNVIYTSNEIDLPLESVVVNGRYDSTNKKIILTLQNGSTIDIPVGDLINGLQSEITSNNKLSSDLVDDTNKINKFVTSSEKSTWNNKQDTLVSGTNIKTINNESILGSGDIIISNYECKVINGSTSADNPFVLADLKSGIYFINTLNNYFYIKGTSAKTDRTWIEMQSVLFGILFVDKKYEDALDDEPFIHYLIKSPNTTYGVRVVSIVKKSSTSTGLGNDIYNNLRSSIYSSPILHTFSAGATFDNAIPTITPTNFTNDNQIITKKYVDDKIGDINTVLATLTTVGGGN